MAFDGIKKTTEPPTPEGMTAIRLLAGYNKYGAPVAALCNQSWDILGLPYKCDCECGCSECEDEIDNSALIPVGHVQRIMYFVPTVAPAAVVTKALDLSNIITAKEATIDIETIAPDTDEQPREVRRGVRISPRF